MARYSKKAAKKVGQALHEMKEGKLTIGQSDKKVTSKKQAIAIGLSKAKEEGAKVPAKPKKGAAAKKTSAKKAAPKKSKKKDS